MELKGKSSVAFLFIDNKDLPTPKVTGISPEICTAEENFLDELLK